MFGDDERGAVTRETERQPFIPVRPAKGATPSMALGQRGSVRKRTYAFSYHVPPTEWFFSNTSNSTSGSLCSSRIAAVRPEKPEPTVHIHEEQE